MRGELTLFIGNMFSRKTKALIDEFEELIEYGRKTVLAFKPDTDRKSDKGFICSRSGKKIPAQEVPAQKPHLILKMIREEEKRLGKKINAIFFSEIQFFRPPMKFFKTIDELLDQGYDVYAEGLTFNFRKEPFGAAPYLALLVVKKHNAKCSKCGSNKADLPQRIINGKPAPYNSPEILVGDKETYEARCRACHELPKPKGKK